MNKVLELAKNNQLEHLQWKVEQLQNDVGMLVEEKWKSTNDILRLTNIKDELISKTSFMKKERETHRNRMLAGNSNINSINDKDIEV